jgi:hypothetical protein
LLHARWWGWHGDNCWGPRYLVPVMPMLTLLAVEALRDFRPRAGGVKTLALAAFLSLSAFVQVLGGSFGADTYQNVTYDTVIPHYRQEQGALGPPDDEVHVHFIPEFSPLAGNLWLLRHALRGDAREAYMTDYPWRALRPDGAWAPRLPDPPPAIDWWVTRLPREHAQARSALVALTIASVLAVALAGALLAAALRGLRSVATASDERSLSASPP